MGITELQPESRVERLSGKATVMSYLDSSLFEIQENITYQGIYVKALKDIGNTTSFTFTTSKSKYLKRNRNADKYRFECEVRKPNREKELELKYNVYSNPNARFVNICGLSVDSDSMVVALGLNPNPDEFIGIASFKDIIDIALFGKLDAKYLPDEAYTVILEDLKLYSGDVDIQKVLQEFLESDVQQEMKSVTLNIIHKKLVSFQKMNDIKGVVSSSNTDFLCRLVLLCTTISKSMSTVGESLFKSYIAESDYSSYMRACKLSADDIMSRRFYMQGVSYLSSLRDLYISLGISNVFVDSFLSYGFGLNKRKKLVKEFMTKDIYSSGKVKDFFNVYSSLSYVEIFSDGDILSLSDMVKSRCYNIFDLLHAICWEQDLFFAYEVEHNYKNPVMVDTLIKRFQLAGVLKDLNITKDEFREHVVSYANRLCYYMDWGAMYSRKVKSDQYFMGAFSSSMIRNSGRIFSKMSKRLLKKL